MSIRSRILLICASFVLITTVLGAIMFRMQHGVGRIALSMYDDNFMAIDYFRKAEVAFTAIRSSFVSPHNAEDTSRADLMSNLLIDLDVSIEHAPSVQSHDIGVALKARVEAAAMAGEDPAVIHRKLDSLIIDFASGAEEFAQQGFVRRELVETLMLQSESICEIAIVASMILAVAATCFCRWSIVLPIERLTGVATAIASGNLDNAIRVCGRSEVATLSRALDVMQRSLQDQRVHVARIEHMAHHDMLTGLANRVAFFAHMDEAVDVARQGNPFALLMLDLDRFKAVNDTHGHGAGDTLLRIVASRLSNCVRCNDVVARLGGDEFAIMLPNGQADKAELLAERVVSVLSEIYDIEGMKVSVGASVGVATSADGCSADEIRRRADLTLYLAKGAGRGTWRRFDESIAEGNLPLSSRRAGPPSLILV